MAKPYYAQITFKINIHPVNQDGTLNPDKLTKSDLEKYDMTDTAVFGVHGFNIEDCVGKVKQVLENLKYE